jgi:hypothetical protein
MKNNKNKNLYALIIIFLIITAFIFFFLIRGYMNYAEWKDHRDYFKQSNTQIESWMSINLISTKFNLTTSQIYQEIGVNGTQINKHLTLDLFCKKYQKDCQVIINNLNNLKK